MSTPNSVEIGIEPSVISLLRCPNCHAGLVKIDNGLQCVLCGDQFTVQDDIIQFYRGETETDLLSALSNHELAQSAGTNLDQQLNDPDSNAGQTKQSIEEKQSRGHFGSGGVEVIRGLLSSILPVKFVLNLSSGASDLPAAISSRTHYLIEANSS
ncbi:hypothetical protein ACFL17_10435, partial [Pseudomonadota bacterium]